MNIIILGPQGSGKDTQAELLSKKLGIPIISAGQICRKEAEKNTTRAKKIKSIMLKGEFIPSKWMLEFILERINSPRCKKGFILEGYPRLKEYLDDMKNKIKIDAVFRINVSNKETIRRLTNRRYCRKCNSHYNLITSKPKRPTICDKCDSKLVQRADDKPEAIKRRLNIYHENAKYIFDYFLKNKLLVEINGEQSAEKVHKDVMKELKKRVK